MFVSKRVQASVMSPIRKFLPYAEAAEKQGVKVYYLNIGQPDMPAPPAFMRAVQAYRNPVVAYARSQGIAEVQSAWAAYFEDHGMQLVSDDVLVTTSGSEAFSFAFLAVTDPGDEMIVFEPFYSNYKSMAGFYNIRLVPVLTEVAKGFPLPSTAALEQIVTQRTRAIVITNPCNPTGAVYSQKDLARIAAFAKKHDLWIISDETYREIVFRGRAAPSMMSIPSVRDRVIVVDSVSKRFNLCGARIGCLATANHTIKQEILKLCQARLSSPTIEQLAVVPVLKRWKPITDKVRREYKKRRDIVWRALGKMPGVVCGEPEGALYIIAKYPIDDAERFVKWMLADFRYRNQTVMLTPAKDFYMTPGRGIDEMRLAYVLSVPKLKAAMETLAAGLADYRKTQMR